MIKNEIGSEFWSVQVKDVPNHFFPKNTQWFLSGRSALTYILKDIIKKAQSIQLHCRLGVVKA